MVGGLSGLSLLLSGCALLGMGGSATSACIDFTADADLPHPVTLWVFALESTLKFEQEPIANLLNGVKPKGVIEEVDTVTLGAGDTIPKRWDGIDARTQKLGVVADYLRRSSDPDGSLRQVVAARCMPLFTPRLHMKAGDLYVP